LTQAAEQRSQQFGPADLGTSLYPEISSIRRKRVVNVRMTIRAKKGVSSSFMVC
jgi:hypothetical protein